MTLAQLLALCFAACSMVCALNVYRVLKDRDVRGVSIIPVIVFIITNVIEIAYFAEVKAYWSALGAAGMLAGNTVWLALCLYYRHTNKGNANVPHHKL